jgi:molybdopterin/thiamine biosynthesis adenylyltransferase/SAM-dependent methyltransferase
MRGMGTAPHATAIPPGEAALDAYEALAPVYDGLTAHHDYERWLGILEGLARRHGHRGRRLFDVACGTGKSFLPLARRGYQVEACDISPSMIRLARAKSKRLDVRLRVADMRTLPTVSPRCDLVTCLDDAVNYLLAPRELVAGLRGMRRNLRPGGTLIFDGNTLSSYRSVFCSGAAWSAEENTYVSRGEPQLVAEGALFATTLEAWRGQAGTGTLLASSRHVQRHYGPADFRAALAEAGLDCAAIYGSEADGTPAERPDEERHVKTIVVARRPLDRETQRREVRRSAQDREDRPADRAGSDLPEGRVSVADSSSRAATAREERPRLKETVERFPASDGTLYLLRPGRPDLALPELSADQQALLAALDGRHSPAELADLSPDLAADEVDATLAQLAELGLLEDGASDSNWLGPAQIERYDRQLAYFGELVPAGAARAACQARLTEASVVVIGLGGLGSWTAWALAAAGVGCIAGVDGDVVEPSNLNRQILYREADVGRPKAAAAARALGAFNSDIELRAVGRRLESEADVAATVAGADFVVEAADRPPHLLGRWINSACAEAGVPHVSASQFPPTIRVGPTVTPGRPGCLACLEEQARREHPLFDELAAWRRETANAAATFAPACALVGGMVAADVVHAITGLSEPATRGAALVVDIRTFEVTREPVQPREGCEVCG